MENISDFEKWTECGNGWDGHYRYVIGAKVAYEIIVIHHDTSQPISSAIANLYVIGLWREKDGSITLEREVLGENKPIGKLVSIAEEDYIENFK